jgi:hypothetical protein
MLAILRCQDLFLPLRANKRLHTCIMAVHRLDRAPLTHRTIAFRDPLEGQRQI